MSAVIVLPEEHWQPLQAEHARRVTELTADRLRRAATGAPHPVEDFLFTYYSYRPGQWHKWHPGWGFCLAGRGAA
ncbi:MAG: 3-methyladenine DNA glycosylase, partial [Angustibacter sp.]